MREEVSSLRDRLQQFEDLEGSIQAALVHAEQAANGTVQVFANGAFTYTPEPGWNGRLVYTFGGGCNVGYHQGATTGGVLNDLFLSQGYAVATSAPVYAVIRWMAAMPKTERRAALAAAPGRLGRRKTRWRAPPRGSRARCGRCARAICAVSHIRPRYWRPTARLGYRRPGSRPPRPPG